MAEPKNSMINDMKATDSASRETIQNIDDLRGYLELVRDAVMPSVEKMKLLKNEALKKGLDLGKGSYTTPEVFENALKTKREEETKVIEGLMGAMEEQQARELESQPEPGLHSDLPPNVTDN
tara:strand:+ start:223 stop:588 length:366 start_codon:yes stop_codon:yes gene_type:complete